MVAKTRNRMINLIGIIIGGALGYFYPYFVQGFLPVIGIGVGIFYFLASNSVNKNPDKETVTDFNAYTWYSILKFFMGILIGGAITSTIVLTIDIMEQQKQVSLILSPFV